MSNMNNNSLIGAVIAAMLMGTPEARDAAEVPEAEDLAADTRKCDGFRGGKKPACAAGIDIHRIMLEMVSESAEKRGDESTAVESRILMASKDVMDGIKRIADRTVGKTADVDLEYKKTVSKTLNDVAGIIADLEKRLP